VVGGDVLPVEVDDPAAVVDSPVAGGLVPVLVVPVVPVAVVDPVVWRRPVPVPDGDVSAGAPTALARRSSSPVPGSSEITTRWA